MANQVDACHAAHRSSPALSHDMQVQKLYKHLEQVLQLLCQDMVSEGLE